MMQVKYLSTKNSQNCLINYSVLLKEIEKMFVLTNTKPKSQFVSFFSMGSLKIDCL